MQKIISQRIIKKKFFKHLIDILIMRELKKRAEIFNLDREIPFAVFANDWIGININVHGLFEKEYIEDLKKLLVLIDVDLSNSIAIDVGANIGNHSIEFSKYFEKVVCFEPNPRVFDVLHANIKQIKNIVAYNFGCGANKETLTLNEDFNNLGSSSARYKIKSNNLVEVNIKPLDDYLNELKRVCLIKIDVEGMEIETLKGAENVIKEFKPLICFEQREIEFTKIHVETEAIDWLRNRGYRIYSNIRLKRRNIILRRFNNLKQFIFGVIQNRKIVEFQKLPKGNYSMIYAIHSSMIRN